MNVKRPTGSEAFAIAASAIIEAVPHGQHQTIAKEMGIRPPYLSDLVAGRRKWTDALRDKFATSVGKSVAELYAIGDEYVRTGAFFPYIHEVKDTHPNSAERGSKIIRLVLKDLKLDMDVFASPSAVAASDFKIIKEYLSGRSSDGELYAFMLNLFKKALQHYSLKK